MIERNRAAGAFKSLQTGKNGQVFTEWLFQELGFFKPLANNDARKQERNVALHDFAAELDGLLKDKPKEIK